MALPSSPSLTLSIFFLQLWLLLLLLLLRDSLATTTSMRVELIPVDAMANLTTAELMRRAVQRSQRRISSLTAKTKLEEEGSSPPKNPIHPGNGEYLVTLLIGTPPQEISAIVDSGSDLTWTQCDPCTSCYYQSEPRFNSSVSSTFSRLPCSSKLCQALDSPGCDQSSCLYYYLYQDYSFTRGLLATETIYLGFFNPVHHPVHNIAFGCGKDNQGPGFLQASGILGLGRGSLSIISQMNLKAFSYCFTSFGSSGQSILTFGSPPNLDGTERHTPLIQNPSMPSFYYLSLEGITVGECLVPIPNSTFDIGNGGVIIDSGSSFTALGEPGYELVKQAFRSQVNLPYADGSEFGLDLCFELPSNSSSFKVPKLIFHFEGADLDLPQENYFKVDPASGLLCLMILESTSMTVLGNFQQQNMLVVYDLEREQLSFRPAQCDHL